MYNPRTVACKTVIVTEGICPTPVVTYLDMPEITFDGSTAYCRVSMDTMDGNPPKDVYGGSFVTAYNGIDFDLLHNQINWSLPSQTVTLQWEMKAPTPYAQVVTEIVNSCGGTSGPIQTAHYEYPEGAADITAVDITVGPTTCDAPCDLYVSIAWKNNGEVPGTFTPGYTVNDTLYEEPPSVTLQPGEMHIMSNSILYDMPAGTYVICPSPN
jgi:hypothetical protein